MKECADSVRIVLTASRGTEAGDLSELDNISSVDDLLNVSFSDVEEIQF